MRREGKEEREERRGRGGEAKGETVRGEREHEKEEEGEEKEKEKEERGVEKEGSGHFRRIPIRIKDVAGLVKGAYCGRGRGNAFLNDLCDADVLIHVVDASGKSDGGGNRVDGEVAYDVSDDVVWVYQEIHQWIFHNIRRKWKVIQRDPVHLLKMFSGYHCTPGNSPPSLAFLFFCSFLSFSLTESHQVLCGEHSHLMGFAIGANSMKR